MKISLLMSFILMSHLLISQEDEAREFLINEGDTSYVMKKYIMCFLNIGPDRLQSKTDAEAIQEGHMAHIKKLSDKGFIILAGPFGDDTNLRGILVFDVASVEMARELEDEDPAIKSGRLIAEFHPWWAAKGTILK